MDKLVKTGQSTFNSKAEDDSSSESSQQQNDFDIVYADGSKYKGQFDSDGLRTGYGKLYFTDTTTYIG